jgi:hypothetical protein
MMELYHALYESRFFFPQRRAPQRQDEIERAKHVRIQIRLRPARSLAVDLAQGVILASAGYSVVFGLIRPLTAGIDSG